MPREGALTAASTAWEDWSALLATLDEVDLVRPTRCTGWTVVDLAAHVLMDAERALIACATPTLDPADTDAVSYWRSWKAAADPLAAARGSRFVRVQASAYRAPEPLLAHWRDTSEAAGRALAAREPDERVLTQGHVMTVGDLERTLVVEMALHHLDALLDLPGRAAPSAGALAEVVRTFSALAGVELDGDPVAWALAGGGRVPLSDPQRVALNQRASRFPLVV